LGTLPQEEQARREAFQHQFNPHLNAFNERLLSTSRHISEHRIGASPGPEHEKSTPHGQAVEVIISALKRRLSKPRHVTACLPRSRKPGFFSLDWPGFF
jgi:hypothetical protein